MSIWVSKEAWAPQEWSQLCQMSFKDRFRAKNVNILISNFSFVFFRDFLCIIEVWGAQWIFNISLQFLWKPHHIYPQTSMSNNNFVCPTLGKLSDTLRLDTIIEFRFLVIEGIDKHIWWLIVRLALFEDQFCASKSLLVSVHFCTYLRDLCMPYISPSQC